jgi:hypothetical protein
MTTSLSGEFMPKRMCWFLLLGLHPALTGQPQPPLSPRIANYTMQVRLYPSERRLKGHETLLWHNKTETPANELQFHLYLNAFRNNRSTYMRESGSRALGPDADSTAWGYITVERFVLEDSSNLTTRLQFIQTDDGNSDDKTVVRVPLAEPIRPGGSISLHIDFSCQLPQPPIARTGAKNEYFFVGQWFPKIGVFEKGRWNCHQFHANSEFYADYGVYDVRMTVPQKNILGATGLCLNVENHGDSTATHHYLAEDVHDFAWTTSPDFVEFRDKAQDVEIRALVQKDHAGQGQRHLEAARTAIEYFQNWYGDYPYPNLTVVDPRRGAGMTGGMEYPTLITAGTMYALPEGLRALETVIIHEFGHNYWYGLVANNEFEEPWLDEGINTYSEVQIFKDKYGPVGDIIDLWGLKINDMDFQRLQHMAVENTDQILQNSWSFYSGSSYGANSYAKSGLVLSTLHNLLGKDEMLRVMRTYFERWKFKHPGTQDFIAVVNEVTGRDFNWFFDQALHSNKILDYGIERLSCRAIPDSAGYDYSLAAHTNSVVHTPNGNKKAELFESLVFVRRLGQFVFPVEVEFQFENGAKVRETWDGHANWKKYRFVRKEKLRYATVDPDQKIPLDINLTNNSYTLESQNLAINRLATRLLFYLQVLLDQPDMLQLLSRLSIDF